MPKGQKNIAALVETHIRAPITALGYTIWDVEYVKEGSEWYLRITIDKDGSVDIDDCEKVMKTIDPIITELDPVEGAYHLEVSSPGLERTLRTDAHFEASLGEKICLKLFTAIDGQKSVTGRLTAFDGRILTLETGGKTTEIDKKLVSAANVCFDYENVDYGEDNNEDTNGNE